MELLLYLTLITLASVVLAKSAAVLVHSITSISGYLKLSEFTTSFILVALVTSLPEVAVGISASLAGKPTLSLGNVLGSNLANLTLIVAIPVLMMGTLPVRSILARRDATYMAIIALVPIALLLDGRLGRAEALILLIFYGLYLFRLLQQQVKFSSLVKHTPRAEALKQAGYFILATLFLLGSAQLLVYSATQIALYLKIHLTLVGIVLVAVGTSLPELAFGLKAVKLKHEGEVLGNVLGSVVTNSTIVLALTALISPITLAQPTSVSVSALFLLGVLTLFLIGVYNDKKLDVREALVLLFTYLLFLIFEFGVEIFNLAQKYS